MLFAKYKNGQSKGRKTRTFLRKAARWIEHGYKIGKRDGASGKALVPFDVLMKDCSDRAFTREILEFTYLAYCAGHSEGGDKN